MSDRENETVQTEQVRENPILTGSILKQLLLFFFPILFGSLFQQLYNTVDAVIVGRFVGAGALAAVGGSSAWIVGLVVGFFTGLSEGAGVIISQQYGAGKYGDVKISIHTAYAVSILGGLLLTAAGVFCSPLILRLMNQPADIMSESLIYLRIYFCGMLAIFIFNMSAGILRALGNSKLPLCYLIISSIVNIVLDLLLIIAFQMGVVGVAIATLISQMISAILITGALLRLDPEFRLDLKEIRIDVSCLKKQFALGIPGGFQSIMYTISNMTVQAAVNMFGTMTIAGWTADGKLENFFWVTNNAIGFAVTTFVGQNYGAGKRDRVLKGTVAGVGCHMFLAIAYAGVFCVFTNPLLGIFTSDPEAINVGFRLLHTVTPFYVIFSFVEIFSSVLRGVGDVCIPTLLTMVSICVFRILWITFYLPTNPTIDTAIRTYPISWCISAAAFIIYMAVRGRKKLLA